jgi:hypothetical protein
MAVISADNREMYMDTKPFTNMFGSEVQVSREEFVKRWVAEAEKLSILFYGTETEDEYRWILGQTQYRAGLLWDSK